MNFFLEGLAGKADGEDGTIMLGRLFDYASTETDKYVANKWADVQKPVMLPQAVDKVALVRASDRRPLAANVPARSEMPADRPLKPGPVITNSIGMKLALIPAGEFLMGSPDDEATRGSDEQQHRVRITRPFYLGVYEVTQEEYQKVMRTNPSWFSRGGTGKDDVSGVDTSRFPVEHVSWEDAVEFCRRLSAQDGREYRLPTEAEWEYACRAGTTTEYYTGSGEHALEDAGWYGAYSTPVGNSQKRTNRVGQKRPNAFGLYDMHGNVWEWCSDWYDTSYYAKSPANDPQGPSTGSYRVLRGGGWFYHAVGCRSAVRDGYVPSLRLSYLGFRVALVPSGR